MNPHPGPAMSGGDLDAGAAEALRQLAKSERESKKFSAARRAANRATALGVIGLIGAIALAAVAGASSELIWALAGLVVAVMGGAAAPELAAAGVTSWQERHVRGLAVMRGAPERSGAPASSSTTAQPGPPPGAA